MQHEKMHRKLEKIVFLTDTDKSDLLGKLSAIENVVAVILPFKSERAERLLPVLQIAADRTIQVLRPQRQNLARVLTTLAPDILVSAGYPYLLFPADLAVAKVNLNIHPSLLPRYRGKRSGWFIIANGEKETGVTVHRISEGMDNGRILAQKILPLSPFDTLASMSRKTADLEAPLLFEALNRVRCGELGEEQNENLQTTFLERRTPEDSRIAPNKSILELYNFIRACDAERFPAFFEVAGQRIGIKLFRLEKPEGEDDLL